MITVYVSIGNSDDKLPQVGWSDYVRQVREMVRHYASEIHGQWYSSSDDEYQNACFCVVLSEPSAAELASALTRIRIDYGQDSVAWAEAPVTNFI